VREDEDEGFLTLRCPATVPASENAQGDARRSVSARPWGDAQAPLKAGGLGLGVFPDPARSSLGCPTLPSLPGHGNSTRYFLGGYRIRPETAAASVAVVRGALNAAAWLQGEQTQEREIPFSAESPGCSGARGKLSRRLGLHRGVGEGAGLGFSVFGSCLSSQHYSLRHKQEL